MTLETSSPSWAIEHDKSEMGEKTRDRPGDDEETTRTDMMGTGRQGTTRTAAVEGSP